MNKIEIDEKTLLKVLTRKNYLHKDPWVGRFKELVKSLKGNNELAEKIIKQLATEGLLEVLISNKISKDKETRHVGYKITLLGRTELKKIKNKKLVKSKQLAKKKKENTIKQGIKSLSKNSLQTQVILDYLTTKQDKIIQKADLSTELGMSKKEVSEAIGNLQAANLIVKDGGYSVYERLGYPYPFDFKTNYQVTSLGEEVNKSLQKISK